MSSALTVAAALLLIAYAITPFLVLAILVIADGRIPESLKGALIIAWLIASSVLLAAYVAAVAVFETVLAPLTAG